jgi:type IV pilus assembly protein PilY1
MKKAISVFLICLASSIGAQTIQNNPIGMTASPPPNVMFNLDDSGSMMFEVTPEDLRPNGTEGVSVTTLQNWCAGCSGWISNTFPKKYNLYGTNDYSVGYNIVVGFAHSLPAARYRTAALNLSYYDPNKTYLPWIDPNTGLRMANASATTARYNAMKSTPVMDLTVNQSESGIQWLNDAGNGIVNKNGTFFPATYYLYTPSSCGTPSVSNLQCFTRIEIKPSTTSYAHNGGRTDCGAGTCTYAQEIQNFANWFQYARSRVLAAKYAVGKAIYDLDASVQVGLDAINTTSGVVAAPLPMSPTNKTNYLNNFYNFPINPNGTPSLASNLKLGNWFASNGDTSACRNNHILFITDGYWNDSSSSVGNQDGTSGAAISDPLGNIYTYAPVAPFSDAVSGTLADIAMKFWKTDLNTAVENKVKPSSDDPAFWQHINFHGISFGIVGLLQKDGMVAHPTWSVSQVLADILSNMLNGGGVSWPNPYTNASPQAKIDDLWHATVNGRGQFFNSADANGLSDAIAAIFQAIANKEAAGAASAVSSPNITAANNALYNSQYTTGKWTGEVYRQTMNVSTGVVQSAQTWTTDTTLQASTTSTSAIVRPNGTTPGGDNRRIYTTKISNTSIQDFCSSGSGVGCVGTGAGLTATEKTNFSATGLSQYSTWTPTQKTTAGPDGLIAYLRGRTDLEDDTLNPNALNKLLRARTKVMGDVVNGSAIYVKQPTFSYEQGTGGASYATFKSATREALLFVPANDGMLHAFNPDTGVEKWAYIPPQVWPTLTQLGEKNYGLSNGHRFYVDATPIVADVKDTSASATWKSILIGGMGNGVRGYYALDVTNPLSPQVLWNLCANSSLCNRVDQSVGYASGKAVVTQVPVSGVNTWVALLPSGYDPVSGNAVLIVNAITGALIKKVVIAGQVNKVSVWSTNWKIENVGTKAYVGDLDGNVWGIDLTNVSTTQAVKIATVKDASGTAQPITATIELAQIADQKVMYVATGRLLKDSDGASNQVQSVYAIKDKAYASGYEPRTSSSMVKQTIASAGGGRTVSPEVSVDWAIKDGWYVDFAVSGAPAGERVNVDMSLDVNVLSVVTNRPLSESCSSGGEAWLYSFDIKTGGNVQTTSSTKSSKVAVRLGSSLGTKPLIVRLPNGKLIAVVRLSDATTLTQDIPSLSSATSGRRVSWRELTD